jgi:hypothetical protein
MRSTLKTSASKYIPWSQQHKLQNVHLGLTGAVFEIDGFMDLLLRYPIRMRGLHSVEATRQVLWVHKKYYMANLLSFMPNQII